MDDHRQEGASESKPPQQQKPVFSPWAGLALVAHITAYIIGPLVVIGGLGFWVDKLLHTRRILFFVSIALAFVASNYLVYRKAQDIINRYR